MEPRYVVTNTHYQTPGVFITSMLSYKIEGDKIIENGIWNRMNLYTALNNGNIVNAADIKRNAYEEYIGQLTTDIFVIVKINGENYIKAKDYQKDGKEEDILEMNYGIKRDKIY